MSSYPKNPKTVLQFTAESLDALKKEVYDDAHETGRNEGILIGVEITSNAFHARIQELNAQIESVTARKQALARRINDALKALNAD